MKKKEEGVISMLYKGVKPEGPKIKIGTKVILMVADGDKVNKMKGKIISNNTIDFFSLRALYDVEIDKVNDDGKHIIIKNVSESCFR